MAGNLQKITFWTAWKFYCFFKRKSVCWSLGCCCKYSSHFGIVCISHQWCFIHYDYVHRHASAASQVRLWDTITNCTNDISGQSSWVNSNNVCCFFCIWKLTPPFLYKLRNFTWCQKWDNGWYVGTWVVLVRKLCGSSGLYCWFSQYGMSQ